MSDLLAAPSPTALPGRPACGDGEALSRIAVGREAANGHPIQHSIGPGMCGAVDLEYLASQHQAFAAHAHSIGGGPSRRLAVLARRRHDRKTQRGRRWFSELRDRGLGGGGMASNSDASRVVILINPRFPQNG